MNVYLLNESFRNFTINLKTGVHVVHFMLNLRRSIGIVDDCALAAGVAVSPINLTSMSLLST